MHIQDRQVQPSLPTSRNRSVSAPPQLSSPTKVESPPEQLAPRPQLQRSTAQKNLLQGLTEPQVSDKILARAEQLGSEKIEQKAQKPGFFDRIKHSSFGQFFQKVFSSPPPYTHAKGGLVVPDDAEVVHEHDPGIKAKFGRDTTVYSVDPSQGTSTETLAVKKGDKVNVRKTDNPSIVYVEVYRKTGDKVEVTGKGYAFASHVTSHKQARSHKALGKDAPIFPKEPSPKDIMQGKIGDCFFLAGLSSIVARDPSAVTKMIKDNGDGTVTVKMHDVVVSKERNEHGQEIEKKTFKPKYITFDKSVLHTDYSIREHADKGAPWVTMLEKAYAIHKGSYTMLGEGGFANDVYEAMLGKEAVKEPLTGGSFINTMASVLNKEKNPLFPDGEKAKQIAGFIEGMESQVQDLIQSGQQGQSGIEAVEKLVAKPSQIVIKGQSMETLKAGLVKDLNMSPEDAKKVTDKLFAVFKYGRDSVASSEELAEKLKKIDPPLSEDVQKTVVKYAQPVSLPKEMQEAIVNALKSTIAGPRGSGQYSTYQNDMFAKIKDGLEQGKVMGAGTLHKIEEEGAGQGGVGTAGEEVVKGLVGGHDFSITGAVELKPGDKGYPGPKDGPPMKFVKVRNPWGKLPSGLAIIPSKLLNWAGIPEHGSRVYSFNDKTGKLDAKGSRDAEFLVEMSDFTKHFEDIYYTK